MKKFFTLVVAVSFLTAIQAQNGSRDNGQKDWRNDNGYEKVDVTINTSYGKDGRFDNRNSVFDRKRNMEIAKINREYDFKIQRVQRNFFMNRWEKQRQIRFLEAQRQHEIRKVYAEFSKKRNRHYDRDDRSGRRY